MNTPSRVALTTAIAAAGVTIGLAIASTIQEPLNAMVWQLSYLLPSSLVGAAVILLQGLFVSGYLAVVGYAVSRVWSKRK